MEKKKNELEFPVQHLKAGMTHEKEEMTKSWKI